MAFLLPQYSTIKSNCVCCCVQCGSLGYLDKCPDNVKNTTPKTAAIKVNGTDVNLSQEEIDNTDFAYGKQPGPRGTDETRLIPSIGDNFVGGGSSTGPSDSGGGGTKPKGGGNVQSNTITCKSISVACPTNPSYQLTCCACTPSNNSEGGGGGVGPVPFSYY